MLARFGELGKSERGESEQLVELMIVMLIGLEHQGDSVEPASGLGQHIKPFVVCHRTDMGLEPTPRSGLVWSAMVCTPEHYWYLTADAGPIALQMVKPT